jgi:HlyD family secretion protein
MPRCMIGGLALALVGIALAACSDAPAPAWSGYGEGEYVYVSSPVAGRLATLSVLPGQDVARGAPLFALDADAEQAARAADEARVAQAQAQAANTAKGRRGDEIAVVQAQLAQARAQAELAAADLARQQQLVAQGFITPARLDDAKTALSQAQARVAELGASLQVARLPSRSDEQQAARASADAAAQALRAQAWRVEQMRQSAPAGARVADTYFRVGEWVNAGVPVVSLLPEGAIKARFFVPEAELGSMAPGQSVTIACDGCGAPIAARITRIATQAEYTPPVIFSNAQRAKLVFMVEAKPEGDGGKRLKPGQPLDVRRAAAADGKQR